MAKLKIQKTNSVTSTVVDSYVSPTLINGNHIGGTGGDNSQTVPTIRCSFLRSTASAVDTGYILFQKGMRKFEVNNTSDANTTVATLVNKLSTELTAANTMSIVATTATIVGANVANIGAGSGSFTANQDYAYVQYASGNVTGNPTITVGHQITGTSLTGNVTVVAVNSTGNVTVSVATQDVSDEQINVSVQFNASRITNKYVWDWNNNKYRYWFSAPSYTAGAISSQPDWQDTVFVQVANN
jgi:hypothetical protein